MNPNALIYIIAVCSIMTLAWMQYHNTSKFTVPLRYYPTIFAVPFAICIMTNDYTHYVSKLMCLLFDKPFLKGSYFILICIWVSIAHIAIKKMNSSKLGQSKNTPQTQNRRESEEIVTARKKRALWRAARIILSVVTVSVVLLLIYTELLSVNNDGGISSGSLVILTAVLALSAALYGTQRTLKQESTKNRQEWINNVRLESANLIALVDKVKFYEREYKRNNDFCADQDQRMGFYQDQRMGFYLSLLDICTKLRLLLNPKDLLAPILTVQLDAIINYVTAHNSRVKQQDDSKMIKDCILSIDAINLRESFMPWVQILLKVEWERVKDILESKEELIEGYYSKEIYIERWKKNDLYNYGVNVNAGKDDNHQSQFNGEIKGNFRKNMTGEFTVDSQEDLLSVLFPGFSLAEDTKKRIKSDCFLMRYLSDCVLSTGYREEK